MSIWWNGGNQLISSPAVMKCVVQEQLTACTRQCPDGVSSTCSQSTRVLCAPAPSLHPLLALARTSAARPCPNSVSLRQWPWHKSQTFNKIKSPLKSVSVTFLDSCKNFQKHFDIDNLYLFFSDRQRRHVTSDDVNWLGQSSKCQGRKLQPCD